MALTEKQFGMSERIALRVALEAMRQLAEVEQPELLLDRIELVAVHPVDDAYPKMWEYRALFPSFRLRYLRYKVLVIVEAVEPDNWVQGSVLVHYSCRGWPWFTTFRIEYPEGEPRVMLEPFPDQPRRIEIPEDFMRVKSDEKRCGNCGATLRKGANFCPVCGVEVAPEGRPADDIPPRDLPGIT